MNASIPAAVATAAVTYKCDDFVLYRDPERFWAGAPTHTFVCRVDGTIPFTSGEIRYTLARLNGGGLIKLARAQYMRLLPPADAMRDIDTAPLNTGTVADDMTPAAVAWLRQHLGQDSSTLPARH
ncbi:hypothetical protein [Streptomyces sp. NPDC088135]|uniref:hypothetical protein n=1 Tax=Streptomyces sp. NPDC088135 TaxID=3160993 RepID=UPI00341399BE